MALAARPGDVDSADRRFRILCGSNFVRSVAGSAAGQNPVDAALKFGDFMTAQAVDRLDDLCMWEIADAEARMASHAGQYRVGRVL